MQLDAIRLDADQPLGLTPTENLLVNMAIDALGDSINIATGAGVAAAVMTTGGHFFTGATLTLAIPSALCAERVAVAHAHANRELAIQAIAVVRKNGGHVMPCGQCLQLLSDVQTYTRTRMLVYSVDAERDVVHRAPLDVLLPYPFASRKLSRAAGQPGHGVG